MQFRKNTPEPTPEDLGNRPAFQHLIDRVAGANRRLWLKAASAITGIAALLALLFYVNSPKDPMPMGPGTIKPLVEMETLNQTFTVNASEGGSFVTRNGSVVHVPANAFAYANGQPVEGPVTLTLREFQTLAEVLASGIPMTYDSAGQTYHFETAGMFQLFGSQNGREVVIASGKTLSVDVASAKTDDRFNAYRFDTLLGNWVSLGDVNPIRKGNDQRIFWESPQPDPTGSDPVETLLTTWGETRLNQTYIRSKRPLPDSTELPGVKEQGSRTIALDFSENEFPELTPFKNVQFEIAPNALPPGIDLSTFSSIDMKKNEEEGGYLIILENGKQHFEFNALPVFADSSQYRTALTQFTKKRETLKKQQELDKQQFLTDLAKLDADRQRVVKQWLQDAENKKSETLKMEHQQLVYRTVQVNQFGTYNCDYPMLLPPGKGLPLVCLNQNGERIGFSEVYLIDQDERWMYTYYNSSFADFKFFKQHKNMLVGVASNGHLLLAQSDAFAEGVSKANGECRITFTDAGADIRTVEQLQTLLALND